MSIVGDLREALQDVVAPDLKAVVRGLNDLQASMSQLREEMHAGTAQLREEMRAGTTQLREEMHAGTAQLREDMKALDQRFREEMSHLRNQADANVAALRDDTRQHIQLLREEMRGAEIRSIERLENLQTVMKLELANRKVAELEEQLRARTPQEQQH